jgi:arginine utilization regulatory protein
MPVREPVIDLEHLSADLRVVLDSINEGIHIVDTSGITVFYNKVAADLDNLNPAEVVGRHILSIFPSLSEDTSTLLSVLRTGRPAPVRQQTFRNFKGDTITTVNSSLPIYSGARLVGAIEISRDVTLVKALAERVVDLQAQLLSESAGQGEQSHLPKAGTARYTFSDVVAASQSMLHVVECAKRAAASSSSIIVAGETGTGKEVIVQSIHNSGSRSSRPFIAQNCAALPDTLLEGILFGTAKGAFTGAQNRLGLFEVANHGTIFLDEVDAMPLPLQAKLLRVLQEGTLRRIGESAERHIDVRVISAISCSPSRAVERGLLRRDLFHRLGVIIIEIPPLRERTEDIPALTHHFVRKYSAQFGVGVRGVSREVMGVFMEHAWPGNVRELQHAVEAAVQMSQGPLIGIEHLPPHIGHSGGQAWSHPAAQGAGPARAEIGLIPTLQQMEENMLRYALDSCGGNVSAAARQLGIPRQTLQHKLKRYLITPSTP